MEIYESREIYGSISVLTNNNVRDCKHLSKPATLVHEKSIPTSRQLQNYSTNNRAKINFTT